MVSTTHHVTAQNKPAQTHAIGAANVPETDGFDFMSYLLGLQVGAQPENMLTENDPEMMAPANGKKPEAVAEDPLLSIFGKKKNASWNPMFPDGLPVAPNANPMNVSPQVNVTFQMNGNPEKNAALQMTDNRQVTANPQMKVAPQVANAPVTTDPNLVNAAALSGKDGTKSIRPNADSKAQESSSLLAGTPGSIQSGNELNGAQPGNAKGHESLSKLTLQRDQASVAEANALDGQKHAKVQAQGGNKEAFTAMNLHAIQPKEESLEPKKSEHRRDSADTLSALGLGTTSTTKTSDGTPAAPSVAQTANQTTVPELFSKVESMVHNGGGKMTVSLTPAHLGKVEIQVTTRGKKVEIAISSQNDLAKSAIESKLGELKQSLHTHDLQLGKVEVQVGRDLARPFNGGTGSSFASLAGGNNAYQQQSQGFSNQAQSGRAFGHQSSRSTNPTPGLLAANQPMMGGAAARSNPGHVDIRI